MQEAGQKMRAGGLNDTPLPWWAWAAKRTKVGGGVETQEPSCFDPSPNPSHEGRGVP